jgi:hypothetical protein
MLYKMSSTCAVQISDVGENAEMNGASIWYWGKITEIKRFTPHDHVRWKLNENLH